MQATAAGSSAIHVAAVYGAATPPGKLALALDTAVESLLADGSVSVSRLSLHERPLGFAGARAPDDQDAPTRETVEAIERADGVLFASPVYRGSFPGVLKNLIDLLPVDALRGKPVGLIVVGATSHHYLGVDRHMRDVLSWFGALALPVGVYLTSEDFREGLSTAGKAELHDLAAGLVQVARTTRGGIAGPPPLAARRD